MSIQTELTRIKNAKAAIKAAIEGKGITVPGGTLLDGMAALIESIEAGGGGGTDFSPFSSAKFGTFTASGYSTKTVTIEGVSSCKVFAMRRVNEGGVYSDAVDNIISSVVVNTDTWESYTGVSLFFNIRSLATACSKTPTLSEDTLTFSYKLVGTYEYAMVS